MGLPKELQGPAILLGVGVLVLTVVIMVLVLKPDLARKLIHLLAGQLPAQLGPRIEAAGGQVLQGLTPLSNPPVAAKLGFWSLTTWASNMVAIYLMLLAFNVVVTPMAAVVLVVVTNLSMAIPSAPGYVGPFEFAVVSVLNLLNVAKAQAQSFALIYHFVGLVPVAIMGAIAAIQQGVGLAAFKQTTDPGRQTTVDVGGQSKGPDVPPTTFSPALERVTSSPENLTRHPTADTRYPTTQDKQ